MFFSVLVLMNVFSVDEYFNSPRDHNTIDYQSHFGMNASNIWGSIVLTKAYFLMGSRNSTLTIKSRSLKSTLFKLICEGLKSYHRFLLLYSEGRLKSLSGERAFIQLMAVRVEVAIFFTDYNYVTRNGKVLNDEHLCANWCICNG